MPSNSKRKRTPPNLEAEVLERCRRRCCVCFALDGDAEEKRGQIAHLDHDPSHSAPDNLVFLCMPHHDLYDSGASQSKKLTQAEVRLYRKQLHQAVEDGKIPSPAAPRILKMPGLPAESLVQNVTGVGNVVSGGDINVSIRVPRSGRHGSRTPIIPGTVGENPRMIGYLRYLAKRYQLFKKWDCDHKGEEMRYGLTYKAYEREMGYSMVGTPKDLFAQGAEYLQQRIMKTMLGRMKRNQRLFHPFEGFDEKKAQDEGLPV